MLENNEMLKPIQEQCTISATQATSAKTHSSLPSIVSQWRHPALSSATNSTLPLDDADNAIHPSQAIPKIQAIHKENK
jgi:hypothetical protein